MVDTQLQALLGELCALNEGDVGVVCRIAVIPGRGARVVGPLAVGNPLISMMISRFEGIPLSNWQLSLGRLPSANRWRAQTAAEVSSWLGAAIWGPLGIGSQLGSLVVLDDRVWGWIGTLRNTDRAPFTEHDAQSARPISRHLVERIAAVERAGEASRVAGQASLVIAGGEVAFADAQGAGWLGEGRGERLMARLGPPERGAERCGLIESEVFVARALEGRAGEAWSVTLMPWEKLPATPLLDLSPLQREIAEMAAGGATTAEIASALNRSENTVKTHLKRTYAAAGLATRAELLDMMRDTVPPALVEEDA